MIGEEWLEQLQLELGEGYRIDGVSVGGSNVAFHVIYPDGTGWVYRLTRRIILFPAYIQEVPNWLVPSPHYDVLRLNRKLANLLGDPQLHTLIQKYDMLFHSILETFYEAGEADLDGISVEPEEAGIFLRFLIQTPAVAYRLNDYATSARDRKRQAWAEKALTALSRLGPGDPSLSPETLFDNPLFVWGGAFSEGYFTKAELPEAVSAVKRHLLSLPEEQVQIFLQQMVALLYMMNSMEEFPRPTSLHVFCDATALYPEPFATEEERAAPDEFNVILDSIKRVIARGE